MRIGVVLTGLVIIILGSLIAISLGYPILFILIIGLFNIVLGFVIPAAPGLIFPSEGTSPVKLIVDKASSQSGTYELVFTDSKLIAKKLAGRMGVIGVAIVFAILGGLIGGLTGYSIGELVTQRSRDRIRRENLLLNVVQGDIEISYDGISQIQLVGSRLKVFSGAGPLTWIMPKKYPAQIDGKLRQLIPARAWIGLGTVPP